VRPVTQVAAAGTAALAVAMTAPPPGAVTWAVEWLAPKGSAVAAAASAAKVFLLRLPGGGRTSGALVASLPGPWLRSDF
jgi:hypothetical protein